MNLYKKDANGNIRIWSISQDWTGYTVSHGVCGGAIQHKYTHIEKGKVKRSVQEQIELETKSQINSQLDRGYKRSIEEAQAETTNQLHLPRPMLARKVSEVPINFKSAFVQRKYDGNRCLIASTEQGIVAYSRNGKIVNLPHITDGLNLPRGCVLDGELYCHGETLQTIVSWIKREQADSVKLKYHLYDMVSELPYAERMEMLPKYATDSIHVVLTMQVTKMSQVLDIFTACREQGYEGAIIRHTDLGYEDSKRSKSLLKLKEWQDDEFYVVDVHPSKDGWGILECIARNGLTFRVTAPGTHEEKENVWNNREVFLGKYLTVEYAYLTKDGLPFHPVAKCWR
jgi:ATP-dependent DNA ligase